MAGRAPGQRCVPYDPGGRVTVDAAYTAPQWPDPARPQQFHLDVLVGDLDAAEEAVLALGITKLEGGGKTFRVYADPANKPFCLTRPEES